MKKLYYKLVIVISLVLLLQACETYRFSNAISSHDRGKYAISAEDIDSYLEEAKNGAFKTKAEIIRGESYYELALKAYNKENLPLATRFSILANNAQADTLLARCYYDFAQLNFLENKESEAFNFYKKILVEIPSSHFIPQIYYERINWSLSQDTLTILNTWDLYKDFYEKYPDDSYEIKSRELIHSIHPAYIQYCNDIDLNDGVDKLLEMYSYPVGKTRPIANAISDLYINKAEKLITTFDYLNADNFFRLAVHYNPQQQDYVEKRLVEIASLYIDKGYEYVEDRDFDSAFKLFNKTFTVIPGYKKALQAIEQTTEFIAKIEEAERLAQKATRYEETSLRTIFPGMKRKISPSEKNKYQVKKYEQILELLQKAYNLDNLATYQQRIVEAKNLIQRYKDPEKFALEIIKAYKSNIVQKPINEAKKLAKTNNEGNDINDDGWEVMLSFGKHNFEARYTITSQNDKYYFKWLVNLRNKEIKGLNKLSIHALEGKLFIEKDDNEGKKKDDKDDN